MKHTTTSSADKRRSRRVRTKRLSVCALLCALGVTVLYLGSLIELLDACTAAVAALLTVLVTIEYGSRYAWGLYAATALLSLFLLPVKTAAAIYLLFGYYPILKAYFERMRSPWCHLTKQLFFLVSDVAAVAVSAWLITGNTVLPWMNAALLALGLLTLNLFDVALTRLITLYLRKYRLRVGRWMNA